MSICAHTSSSRLTCEHCHSTQWASVDWCWRAASGESWWDAEWRCFVCDRVNTDTYDEEECPW